MKHCVTLLRAATMNNVLPADYTNQLDEAERSISSLKLKSEEGGDSPSPMMPIPVPRLPTEVA